MVAAKKNAIVSLVLLTLGAAYLTLHPQELKADPVSKNLTYSKDIAPILNNRCAACHQEGGIAPFSLTDYPNVKKRVSTIDAVVASKYMPPWKPASGHGEFANERCMSAAEIDSLHQWIVQGAAPGDLTQLPSLPEGILQRSGKWRAGQPDIIIKMDKPFKVPADGPDIYRCFVFPLNNDQNKFVSNVEFHPGNPKVTHHALFFLDNTGTARKKDEANPGLGFASFGGPGFLPTGGLGGWAPGNTMQALPDGVSRVIRSNSDLVIQMHFHPNGKEQIADAEIGIYLSKKPPKSILLPLTLASRKIDIPANEKAYSRTATATVPADFDLLQVTPHAHLLCRDIKCEATTPDGTTIPLIWIKNWDFNWQEQYSYKKTIHLPEGTTIKGTFTYDNSKDNFRNPNNPPKRVTWGEQTTDEMALVFFGGTVSKRDDMQKYMRGLIFGNLKNMPRLGTNPHTAFKALRVLMNPKNNPLNQLEKQLQPQGKN